MAAPAISWRVSLAPVSVQTGVAILVPARGGSKRLPGKNIRRLGGASLLEWTWRAVQAAEIPVVPFLSTDDEAIADEGRRLGFRVPGLRPRQLAEDDTPTPDVVLHWLDTTPEFGQSEPELIMLLQATSPFRHPDLLRDGLANMRANKEAQALVAVKPVDVGLAHIYTASAGYLSRLSSESGAAFVPSGALYMIRPAALRESKTFTPSRCLYLQHNGLTTLDIDTEDDWIIAEAALGAGRISLPEMK
ncbi:MAG: acylneuraminate cytidylyltransferase family protein [Pseudorhodoplanes sp.]|nr:MAG: acylneuraminate cytidylyltransferase family protein [Pseudorhodoplanes sp.]